ncbi:MAG: sigma-70 family RNA polymerase sigma factor [Chloroflexi bacterium]|nr:sigma-70 family RNA polymerase sigma factor [Chloroflexota bacterium]
MRDNHAPLRMCIEEQAPTLLRTLRFYLQRAGLPASSAAAIDLLNAVVEQALTHAAYFDPTRPPLAWLLGIAANLIHRQQVDNAKRQRREPLVRDLYPQLQDLLSDDEVFDLLAAVGDNTPQGLEAQEAVNGLLALVSPADQEVLQLAILYELDGEALARALGITPGAARVRLHRALHRLRAAQLKQGESYAPR